MGFISFVGRVLFASLFLLSAYQEYVPRPSSTPSSPTTPQIPSRLSTLRSSPNRGRSSFRFAASPSVASVPIWPWWLGFGRVQSKCFLSGAVTRAEIRPVWVRCVFGSCCGRSEAQLRYPDFYPRGEPVRRGRRGVLEMVGIGSNQMLHARRTERPVLH